MILFYYDETFDGLLTALFDAYEQKIFPDMLLGDSMLPPLFIEKEHHVETDKKCAARVWAGIEKKAGKEICNLLMCIWLSELQGSDFLIFNYMKKIFDRPSGSSFDFADAAMLEGKKIADKVMKERLFLIQFVRFQKASDGSFFAPVSPQYNALPLAINHFKNRFADQKWLIYDLKREYGFYYNLEKVAEVTLLEDAAFLTGKLDDELAAEDEIHFQKLWKTYFKSMTIKERINPKLQRQHMPRRFWKYLTEMDDYGR